MKSYFISSLFFCVSLLSCNTNKEEPLTIAAAANTQFALKELIADFEKKEGITCHLITGSSGKLAAQIKEGAPYDVFLSADMKYPEFLHNIGKANKPQIYAEGNLVLWTTKPNQTLDIQEIANQENTRIALANPEIAPYGKAATDYLKELSLYDTLKERLVYGENIAQASQFVLSQSAEYGFVAKSIVLAPAVKEKGKWVDINCKSCTPILQGAVVVKNNNQNEAKAQKFIEYLLSMEGKEILKQYGYSVN